MLRAGRLSLPLLLALAVLVCGAVASAADDPGLTLSASPRIVVYGGPVRLSGTVSADLSSKVVTILAQSEGEDQHAFATAGPGLTAFRYVIRPRIRTTFVAQAESTLSRPLVVFVRPHVTLERKRGAFVARVVAGRSFVGRPILLQRLTDSGVWVGVKRAVLRRNPLRVRLKLRSGRWKIRAFVPRSPEEPGYLEGFSRPLVVKRGARGR